MLTFPSHPLYFLGIRFWNKDSDRLLREMDRCGGMLAVPSAPSLADSADDPELIRAYRSSDWAVVDGGYVAIILRFLGQSVQRISGLQLIERLVARPEASPIAWRERRILWVVPHEAEEQRIHAYLVGQGFDPGLQSYYQAPYYASDEEFRDEALMARAAEETPDWVVLCIGGGRQEKLGYHLRHSAGIPGKRPAILCIGAAIAFFTGGQAAIPTWADRLYLGWLMRVVRQPAVFLPRYIKAAWHMPAALWHFRGQWFAAPEEIESEVPDEVPAVVPATGMDRS